MGNNVLVRKGPRMDPKHRHLLAGRRIILIPYSYLASRRIIFQFSNSFNYITISVCAIIGTLALNATPSRRINPTLGGIVLTWVEPDYNPRLMGGIVFLTCLTPCVHSSITGATRVLSWHQREATSCVLSWHQHEGLRISVHGRTSKGVPV